MVVGCKAVQVAVVGRQGCGFGKGPGQQQIRTSREVQSAGHDGTNNEALTPGVLCMAKGVPVPSHSVRACNRRAHRVMCCDLRSHVLLQHPTLRADDVS